MENESEKKKNKCLKRMWKKERVKESNEYKKKEKQLESKRYKYIEIISTNSS